jgi:hypothetical protein
MKQAIFCAALCAIAFCGFAVPSTSLADSTYKQIPEPQNMLAEILKVTGLQCNIELKPADVLNIEASISRRKRYILYNPTFIKWINSITKDKWASMALVAHEVGHHLNGHTIMKSGSTPELELEADQFAGFVLHKLGASLSQAQEVMKYIARTETSKTHPGRTLRMSAIETGWNKATSPDEMMASVKPGEPAQ